MEGGRGMLTSAFCTSTGELPLLRSCAHHTTSPHEPTTRFTFLVSFKPGQVPSLRPQPTTHIICEMSEGPRGTLIGFM